MSKFEGYWAKCWGGRVVHYWIGRRETLCGKTHLVPHTPGDMYSWVPTKCRTCLKKYEELKKKECV